MYISSERLMPPYAIGLGYKFCKREKITKLANKLFGNLFLYIEE